MYRISFVWHSLWIVRNYNRLISRARILMRRHRRKWHTFSASALWDLYMLVVKLKCVWTRSNCCQFMCVYIHFCVVVRSLCVLSVQWNTAKVAKIYVLYERDTRALSPPLTHNLVSSLQAIKLYSLSQFLSLSPLLSRSLARPSALFAISCVHKMPTSSNTLLLLTAIVAKCKLHIGFIRYHRLNLILKSMRKTSETNERYLALQSVHQQTITEQQQQQ